MKLITFAELKEYVDVRTKEERVPSANKLICRKTKPVVHGRFGKFEKIRIMEGRRTIFLSCNGGTFEDFSFYPAGGFLGGMDMSQKSRAILVRTDEDIAYEITSHENLRIVVDGITMPDGMWLPEIQLKKWRSMKDCRRYKEFDDPYRDRFMEKMKGVSEITVFVDGSVVYYSGGHHSTFALCKCGECQYASVTDTVRIHGDELDRLPWHIRLTMVGEDRIAKNLLNKRKEDAWDYDRQDMWQYGYYVKEFFNMEMRDDLLWNLLLDIDADVREMIWMYYFGGWKQSEIADVMECARETVSRRINEGIAKMRREYEKNFF